jgi:nitroreductase
MNVSEAVARRKSIRAFLEDKPVDNEILARLLEKAARSPSGGNVQPWRVFVLNGDSMLRFRAHMRERMAEVGPQGEEPEYEIYPPQLKEPYRSSRFKVGEDMYALLDIRREEKPKRLQWLTNNQNFFGAPAALFLFADRVMGPPQWSDLGMFLQTFMLLAQEEGIDTCAQESWARWHRSVHQFVEAPDEWMLFCGLAIGYRDPSQPVNDLVTEREPLSVFARFL